MTNKLMLSVERETLERFIRDSVQGHGSREEWIAGKGVLLARIAEPAGAPVSDEQLVAIARKAALDSTHRYSYMPVLTEEAYKWFPHRWVIDAMRALLRNPAHIELPSQPVRKLADRLATAVCGDRQLEGFDVELLSQGHTGSRLSALIVEMAGHEAEAYALQDQVDEANSSVTALEQRVAELEALVRDVEPMVAKKHTSPWFTKRDALLADK